MWEATEERMAWWVGLSILVAKHDRVGLSAVMPRREF